MGIEPHILPLVTALTASVQKNAPAGTLQPRRALTFEVTVDTSRHDFTQEPSQEIRSGYYAFSSPETKIRSLSMTSSSGMFRLHLHATDHAAQWCAHIGYDDRTMPVDFRVSRHCIEE